MLALPCPRCCPMRSKFGVNGSAHVPEGADLVLSVGNCFPRPSSLSRSRGCITRLECQVSGIKSVPNFFLHSLPTHLAPSHPLSLLHHYSCPRTRIAAQGGCKLRRGAAGVPRFSVARLHVYSSRAWGHACRVRRRLPRPQFRCCAAPVKPAGLIATSAMLQPPR